MPPVVPPSALLGAVLAASADIIALIDSNGDIHDANNATDRVLGRPRESWIGRSLLDQIHPDDRTLVVDHLSDLWSDQMTRDQPARFRIAHAAGHWVTLEATGAHRIDLGEATGVVLVIRDVTQQIETERRLGEASEEFNVAGSHDLLTQLPDRQRLLAHLDDLARKVWATEQIAHVIVVKILYLEELRQLHGVDEITSIIRRVVSRIRGELDQKEFIAVAGVGEIVAAIGPARTTADVVELATRLLALADTGLSTQNLRVQLDLSVGISELRSGQAASEVLDRAARAAASGSTDGDPVPIISSRASERDGGPSRAACTDVQRALAAGELEVWYQPIVDTNTGQLNGFEGLLRWRHPEAGLRVAGEFLPGVEATNVMLDIGEFVLAEGCSQLGRWQDRFGSSAPFLTLNISARELQQDGFADNVDEQLARAGAAAHGLFLELTETHSLTRGAIAVDQLAALRERGVRLALDDFGTGYSCLQHLNDVKAEVLKIDRGFIEQLGRDPGATAIVRATVDLGAAFGMITVAEGVTTEQQRRRLRSMGCHYIQGFLIAPAVCAETADAMLLDHIQSVDPGTNDSLLASATNHRAPKRAGIGDDPSLAEIVALAGASAATCTSAARLTAQPAPSSGQRHDARASSDHHRFEL